MQLLAAKDAVGMPSPDTAVQSLSGPPYSGPPHVTTITLHLLWTPCAYFRPPDVTPVMSHLLQTSCDYSGPLDVTPTLDHWISHLSHHTYSGLFGITSYLFWTSQSHCALTPELLMCPAHPGPPLESLCHLLACHITYISRFAPAISSCLHNLLGTPLIPHSADIYRVPGCISIRYIITYPLRCHL